MLFVFRIEGDILKANIAYISCVANYLPAIFARCIIYTHHIHFTSNSGNDPVDEDAVIQF